MNIQYSQGSHSPNINGKNVVVGDNNKQKNKTVKKKKKVAEYTIGGIIIALLISILGSYLVNTCAGNSNQAPKTLQAVVQNSTQQAQ